MRGQLTPQADTHQLFADHDDRTGPSESNLFMLLHNTKAATAVVIIMLQFMIFGVWHKRDSGKGGGGGENFGDFLKRERSKCGCQIPLYVSNGSTTPNKIWDIIKLGKHHSTFNL